MCKTQRNRSLSVIQRNDISGYGDAIVLNKQHPHKHESKGIYYTLNVVSILIQQLRCVVKFSKTCKLRTLGPLDNRRLPRQSSAIHQARLNNICIYNHQCNSVVYSDSEVPNIQRKMNMLIWTNIYTPNNQLFIQDSRTWIGRYSDIKT